MDGLVAAVQEVVAELRVWQGSNVVPCQQAAFSDIVRRLTEALEATTSPASDTAVSVNSPSTTAEALATASSAPDHAVVSSTSRAQAVGAMLNLEEEAIQPEDDSTQTAAVDSGEPETPAPNVNDDSLPPPVAHLPLNEQPPLVPPAAAAHVEMQETASGQQEASAISDLAQSIDSTQQSLRLDWSVSEAQDNSRAQITQDTHSLVSDNSFTGRRRSNRRSKAVKIYDPVAESARPQLAVKPKVDAPCAVRTLPPVEHNTGVSDGSASIPTNSQAATTVAVVARTVSSQEFLHSLQAFGANLNSSSQHAPVDTSMDLGPRHIMVDTGESMEDERPCSTQQGSEYLASLVLGSESDVTAATTRTEGRPEGCPDTAAIVADAKENTFKEAEIECDKRSANATSEQVYVATSAAESGAEDTKAGGAPEGNATKLQREQQVVEEDGRQKSDSQQEDPQLQPRGSSELQKTERIQQQARRSTRSQPRTRKLTPPPPTARKQKASRVRKGTSGSRQLTVSSQYKPSQVEQNNAPKDEIAVAAIVQTKPAMHSEKECGSAASEIRAHLTGYKPTQKASLKASLEALGVAVIDEVVGVADLDDLQITHLIAPPRSRNMKKLAAQATQRWVVHDEWITCSVKLGRLLPEKDYGARGSAPTLRGKTISYDTAFKIQHASTAVNVRALRKLIAFCGGQFKDPQPDSKTASSAGCSYTLVGDRKGSSVATADEDTNNLSIEEFIAMASGDRDGMGSKGSGVSKRRCAAQIAQEQKPKKSRY